MSFERFTPDDFIVSSDAISATAWTTGAPTLITFFTSSTQAGGSSGAYYLNVYQTSSALSGSAVQFAIAFGNANGSGSANYDNAVNGKSPTGTVFGQWQDLVIGDENTNFTFGALTLKLSGSEGTISLTDNSNYVTTVQYGAAGRIFQLITGSAGTRATITSRNTVDGYSAASGSYGWLLPDIGTIILNPLALAQPSGSGGINFVYSGSASATGSIVVTPNTSLYQALSGSGASSFTINSQETITSDYVFVRPKSSQFNYSENPSFISGSTGEVLYPQFINNPQTYITTIGLYNDTNELLAVAKLSRPLPKDFTKEALVRVKLDF